MQKHISSGITIFFIKEVAMNKDDLRVVKTEKALRSAYRDLIMKKPADEITVTAVTEAALVNRRTFYLHYNTTDDLERDVADEYADDTISAIHGSLAEGIHTYYESMNGGDTVFQRLLYSDDTYIFFREYTDRILSCDFFGSYYKKAPYPELARGLFDSITSIYLSWRQKKGNRPSLQDLSSQTADLIMHGLNR